MDKPTYRGRGPTVPQNVDMLIAEEYLRDEDQTAKEVMNNVHRILQSRGWQLRPDWPGISYVQKQLTDIRDVNKNRPPELKKLDQVWSIGTLAEYDIPPEAIPMVVQIQDKRHEAEKPLTIREARWAGRLYKLTTDISDLGVLSLYYAYRERISELTGVPLDTHDIDDLVLKMPVGALSMLFLEFATDSQLKGFDSIISELEEPLALDLGKHDLRGAAIGVYTILLLKLHREELQLSEEELKQYVLDMRKGANLIAEKSSGGRIDIQSLHDSIGKEMRNARPHTEEG